MIMARLNLFMVVNVFVVERYRNDAVVSLFGVCVEFVLLFVWFI